MKVNKWTLGLAAAGLVSLPAITQAEEKPSPIMTALSSTTISGYVNTSAQWDIGSGNIHVPNYAFNQGKQDGFNLNVVKLAIEKPMDEAEWAAGYKAELLFGPDANALATASSPLGSPGSDFAIKQAYVSLRAPVGNNLDFKLGVFDTIIGYEVFDAGANPNFSRSYGYTIEPTTHTGLLATYRLSEVLSVSGGVANTHGPSINQRASHWVTDPTGNLAREESESYKTYMASVAVTAPQDWGALAGSTLYGIFINGFDGARTGTGANASRTHLYGGATFNTPLKTLKVGAAYDYTMFGHNDFVNQDTSYAWMAALYSSLKLTEKLSFHARGEYGAQSRVDPVFAIPGKVVELTGTLQYDLWKNVLSRLEFRWDHAADGSQPYGGTVEGGGNPTLRNWYSVAVNVIYNF